MKLSGFKQNITKAQDGTWVDVGDGLQILVARQGNKNYTKVIRQLSKPYKTAIRNNSLSDKIYEELQNQATAKAILLNWRGLQDDKGKDIPYSEEKALEILSNPEFEDFKTLVNDLSNEQETFREVEKEELAGK